MFYTVLVLCRFFFFLFWAGGVVEGGLPLERTFHNTKQDLALFTLFIFSGIPLTSYDEQ